MRYSSFLVFFFFFFSQALYATPIAGRFGFLNSASLPKDVWTFGSNISASSNSNYSYDKNGDKVTNQKYFSRDINFGELSVEIKDPVERELADAAFKAYGKSPNESAGVVVNNVDVKTSANSFVLGKGISDKLDFMVIFPVVKIRTSFNSRFDLSKSLQDLAKTLREEGQFKRADEILEKSKNALYEKLKDNGYETQYPNEITTLANIYLNLRYQLKKQTKFTLLSDSFLVVPAGEKFDDNEFLDLRINEEQYSFKQGFTAGYNFTANTQALLGAYYHKRFSFYKGKRIPVNDNGMLSDDYDNNVRVRYGDGFGLTSQFNYNINPAMLVYLGQSLEYKDKDTYRGNDFKKERYELLSNQTNQRLGQFYVGMTLNTINSFLKNNFFMPLDLNLQYSQTNLGVNSLYSETIALNLLGFYK